ncbi:glycosyltransferase [Microbacterium invictum]|uniref:Glycosyltransferase n=1 Tax=Microbacterium invictum TaxID=515415 RepID=A0ABZ0VDE1_9MICO|nr:glycosyltransferase [Microbacterium invictum]WQB69817.1 glycosyltransferase [Microbacterium invictum]
MLAVTKKRVAVVIARAHGRGTGDVGVGWMNWLSRAGYEVDAVSLIAIARPKDLDPTVRFLSPTSPRGLRSQIAAVRRLISDRRIETILASGTRANLVAIAAARSFSGAERPLVAISENAVLSIPGRRLTLRERGLLALARQWYRHADVALSATHPGAAELTAAFGVPASRSLVVPRAVTDPSTVDVSRPYLPASDGAVSLVVPEPVGDARDSHLAVLAAEVLTRRGTPTSVLAPADGDGLPQLHALADLRGVSLETYDSAGGWRRHITKRTVVFLPSDREGFGRPLIEAASLHVPSVAISSTLGVADAIVPGVTGELALDTQPNSIADAVERAARLDVDGVDAWLDRFSADTSGHLLEHALRYAESRRAA